MYTKDEYTSRLEELSITATEDMIQSIFANRTYEYKINTTEIDKVYKLELIVVYSNIYTAEFSGVNVVTIGSVENSVYLSLLNYNGFFLEYSPTDSTSDTRLYPRNIQWNEANTQGFLNFISGYYDNSNDFIEGSVITSVDFMLDTSVPNVKFNFKSGLLQGTNIECIYLQNVYQFDRYTKK